MRFLVLYIFMCFVVLSTSAQKQNNNWCFGDNTGVDFNTAQPSSFFSKVSSVESNASVSDRTTGELLFYTDGDTIWNKQHQIMPNGVLGLLDPQTTRQGSVIVPFATDADKYYVFTQEPSAGVTSSEKKLAYTVVDMSLNAGLGDVVAAQKAVVVDTGFSEGMTTVNDDCGNVWVIVYQIWKKEFRAYKITADGVQTNPVVSPIAHDMHQEAAATIKVAPDRKQLVLQHFVHAAAVPPFLAYTALHDFDYVTGKVTNSRLFTNDRFYACAFSPNSKRLYVTGDTNVVIQYDLDQPNFAAVKASAQTIYTSAAWLIDIQLAADSNLYITTNGTRYLDKISNANAVFPGCIATPKAIKLKGEPLYWNTLPQLVVYPAATAAQYAYGSKDTSICLAQAYTLSAPANREFYSWQDGTKGSDYTITTSGVYWVRSVAAPCVYYTDTIVVDSLQMNVLLPNDTTICKGDNLELQSNVQRDGTSYLWSTGATTESIEVDAENIYTLTVNFEGCKATASIDVQHVPPIGLDLGGATTLCKGDKLLLPQYATPNAILNYQWQDGSSDSTYTAQNPGVYSVVVFNQCETKTDSVTITGRGCHFFFPSAFTPNGDGRNDLARMVGDISTVTDYELRIINRWGEIVFFTEEANKGWDGNYKGKPAELGAYYYLITYKYLDSKELTKGTIMLLR